MEEKQDWLVFLGRCYPRETLEAILRFCEKQSIHLISDEIYAQSVYGTSSAYAEFTSILSVDVKGIIDEKLVHVMYGMSKVKWHSTEVIFSALMLWVRILLPLAWDSGV
jgi:hypothetical protein